MANKACVMTSVHPAFDVRIFYKECRSLARTGYEVTLIAPHGEDQQCGRIRLRAIPKHTGRIQRVLKGTLAVYRAAREEDAEIYHFHDPELIAVGLLLRASGKKVVYDVHEDLPHTLTYKAYIPRWLQRPLASVLDSLETIASARFSALIAATPFIANRFNKGRLRVAVVRNYPLLEEFSASGHVLDRTGDDFVVYVGARITKARGAEEMVRAIGLIDRDVRLKLVGAWDSSELPAILSRIPGWERTDCLGTLGRADVARVMAHARVGLVVLHPEPNYLNSQPVKLFEYMGAGIPVIASDFPVFRDIVEGAKCGLLVNPLDPASIAEAIDYIWNHPREARAMGDRGRAAVELCYNWQHEERKLLELYGSLCTSVPPVETPSAEVGCLA